MTPLAQFFAIEPDESSRAAKTYSNPFAETTRATLNGSVAGPAGLELYAGKATSLQSLHEPPTGRRVYLWGPAAHPDLREREALLRWCLDVVDRRDFAQFTRLIGHFVLIVDDRTANKVWFVNDVLGVRPWFVGQWRGRLVCGTDVWAIRDAGFSRGDVNYEAVSSWLKYGYDCSDGSLFADYRRLGAGVVASWDGRTLSETPYVSWRAGETEATCERVAEGIHERLARAFDVVTSGLDAVTLTLSGGYDSRYLAAMAAEKAAMGVEAYCVLDDVREGETARQVAEALGLRLNTITPPGATLDLYDEPYHFTPGGFPITKHVSYAVAARRPGVPLMNGYLGGQLVRGDNDRVLGKRDADFVTPAGAPAPLDELAAAAQRHHHLRWNRLDLLDPVVVARVEARALEPMRRAVDRGRAAGNTFFVADLLTRQRYYITNNFLQHLHLSEAVLPFYSWDLIDFKLRHRSECFTWDVQQAMFRTFFPKLASIPHNRHLEPRESGRAHPSSRHVRRWARRLTIALASGGRLSAVSRSKAYPRLLAASLGSGEHDGVVLFLRRLQLLEDRLRAAGSHLDLRKL